jgi:hypothetical protein
VFEFFKKSIFIAIKDFVVINKMSSPPQDRFKDRLVQFIDFTKGLVIEANEAGVETPVSPFVLDLSKNFIAKEDSDKIITTFILRSYPNWNRIQEHDLEFMKGEGLKAFYGIPEKNLKEFTALFDVTKPDGVKLMTPAIESQLWDFFESLVKISVCYVHCQRKPDPVTKKYTANFFPDMKVRVQVEAWKIEKLE